MRFSRVWSMPSADTFDVVEIGAFVRHYLSRSRVSIDPFARNRRWATYTNDLNPNTAAEYHLDVRDFLKMLVEQRVLADLVLFDPPYSPRQMKECYDSIGLKMGALDAMRGNWTCERSLINQVLARDGIVLSFGWNSVGMGKERGYEIEEILLCCHGPTHNDTICLAERKVQGCLF